MVAIIIVVVNIAVVVFEDDDDDDIVVTDILMEIPISWKETSFQISLSHLFFFLNIHRAILYI